MLPVEALQTRHRRLLAALSLGASDEVAASWLELEPSAVRAIRQSSTTGPVGSGSAKGGLGTLFKWTGGKSTAVETLRPPAARVLEAGDELIPSLRGEPPE